MDATRNLRTFYTLIFTQTFSLIGSRMTDLALSIYIYNQTGDVTPLALVSVFTILPQIIGASFAGVLADRWDRRYVMMLSDAGQALGTVILLVSFLSGGFQIWHLYIIAFIKSWFGVFQSPAFTAAVTMLVPDDQRDRANALQTLTGPLAGVLAPALTGALYALIGLNGIIGLDLVTFAVAAVVVMFMRIPRPTQTEIGRQMQGTVWKEMVGGLKYMWSWRNLFMLTLHISLVNFLFAGAGMLLTPYLLARTGSEATMGLLQAVADFGMIIGAIIIGVWGGTRPRIHTIMGGILISSLFMIGVGSAQTPVLLGVTLVLMTLTAPMVNASATSLMQAKVPPDIQGRVFAALGQMTMFFMPLSYLLVGPLVDNVFEPAVNTPGWAVFAPLVGSQPGAGMGLIIILAGAGLLITTALVYALPRVRYIESERPDYLPETADSPPEIEAKELRPVGAE
ncbi:MAG: MFS transporter [Chloroflexi bacterium]|uniref:MFS transporter n=1 Tax=Candidatus Flexifilum breve TaxID=3140694 RepID=UPI0031364C5E|nr:MFS transporter [Chloroflexota bacterium]